MILLIKLLLAHLVGDFLLQPTSWVKDKEEKKIKSKYLYYHIGVHALFLLLLLKFDFKYWLGMLVIVASHYIFDLFKIYFVEKKNNRIFFFVDQLLHLLAIIYVVTLYEKVKFLEEVFESPKLLLLLVAVLLVTTVASIVMKVIISKWRPETMEENGSLEDAGKYIGMLERLFVFCFIITNHWTAIGFLITAKSVFRFGDLSQARDRKLTEYILIGTLLSFGLAISVGLLYQFVEKYIS
ncbi:DUF3307 domain-containing protein [Aureivirga sp. CE67]|uniref:DUF3307 domain-containing protein n=1 Tax=Aureivirga sp. CE67 TaxID=1788983 RepID=UPI0018CB115F|nr:DUF3307 domain-containing protein [Aureivirga sp. CE67]